MPIQFIPTLTYREVFNGDPSLGLIENILAQLVFEDMTSIATRIGKSLGASPEAHLYEHQLKIGRGLFGPGISKLLRRGKHDESSAIIGRAFSVGQLVLLGAKHCQAGPRTAAEIATAVGRALVAIEDVVNRRLPENVGTRIAGMDAAKAAYLFAVHCADATRVMKHDLGRTYHLIQHVGPKLAHSLGNQFVDLKLELTAALGLPYEAAIGIALALSKIFSSDDEVVSGDVCVDIENFFSTVRDQSFVAPFKKLFVTTQHDLCAQSAAWYEKLIRGHVDLLPLRARPVVEANGRAYCPIGSLAVEKLGLGLVHTIVDFLPGDRARSARIRTFMGHTFERYVDELLNTIVPKLSGNKIDCNDRRQWPVEDSDRKVDWIVEIGSHLILIDAKANLIPISARSGFAVTELIDFSQRVLNHSVEQFSAAVAALETLRGRTGLSRGALRKPIVFLVIALDEDLAEFPFSALLAEHVTTVPRLRSTTAQIVPIGVIERLHTLASDRTPNRLRSAVRALLQHRPDPFSGPWNAIGNSGGGHEGDPRLIPEACFKDITAHMLDWVRAATGDPGTTVPAGSQS